MRALCLTATGGPQHLRVLDVAEPRLERPDDVRVAVRAVALNHLDLWVSDGLREVPIATFPHIVAADAAGIVSEVGPAVTKLAVGDRVIVNPGISCGECEACHSGQEIFCRKFSLLGEHRSGSAAEQLVVPERNLAAIRGEWEWPEAAAFGLTTLTAWRMLYGNPEATTLRSVGDWTQLVAISPPSFVENDASISRKYKLFPAHVNVVT